MNKIDEATIAVTYLSPNAAIQMPLSDDEKTVLERKGDNKKKCSKKLWGYDSFFVNASAFGEALSDNWRSTSKRLARLHLRSKMKSLSNST